MKRTRLTQCMVFIALAAFLLAGVLSVLPHPHLIQSAGHHCLFCRAQSIQPDAAPPTCPVAPLVFEGRLVVSQIAPAFFEELFSPLPIRSPPAAALFSRG